MRERFVDINFKPQTMAVIAQANEIIEDFVGQGFKLTVRQLYYQFVRRVLIENSKESYNRLKSIINRARLAGYIDWDAIEDRTRERKTNNHWEDGTDLIKQLVEIFGIDLWAEQDYRPEVWIEKEALEGVIEDTCRQLDVPFFACRGYVSQSEQYDAGKRIAKMLADYQTPVIIHLGDHDPSGIDMTRDNDQRLQMFARRPDIEVVRIALNMNQVDELDLPPIPAKLTDSRLGGYAKRFGMKISPLY